MDHDTWETVASNVNSCSFVCENLLPKHEYQFRVIAVYEDGESNPSDITGAVAIDDLGE